MVSNKENLLDSNLLKIMMDSNKLSLDCVESQGSLKRSLKGCSFILSSFQSLMNCILQAKTCNTDSIDESENFEDDINILLCTKESSSSSSFFTVMRIWLQEQK